MNLAALGIECDLVTVLGGDDNDEGTEILREWFNDEPQIRPHVYHQKEYRTPIKGRICTDNGQQLIRFDFENELIYSDASVNNAVWNTTEALLKRASKNKKPSVLILSDYGKGIFSDSMLVRSLLELAQILHIPTIVDPKDPNLARYLPATLIKPNLQEAMTASGGVGPMECAQRLIRELAPRAQAVLVTAGFEGMVLATNTANGPRIRAIPPYPEQQFCNPCGAGDTVTAVLGMQMACTPDQYHDCKHSIQFAAKCASIAAGVVIKNSGTAIIHDWEYRAALVDQCISKPNKMISAVEAETIINMSRQSGGEIVFANGCFDGLHPGHIHLLQEARRMGDMLIVGVNSDASVKRLKGKNRPVITCEQRVKMLEALSCVDVVIVFEEDTPEVLIHQLKPDLLVKGQEYFTEEIEKIPGAKFVIENGHGVIFVKMLDGYSTTNQLAKRTDPKPEE
jgi:D-beta-D-heptose 7-phosphate kinase/D-beta-D-heptose 1-phosphate adenosyltransferase